MQQKIELHKRFWRGEGPSLMLIPSGKTALYDLNDYPRRFHDPQAMWESEMRRAESVVDWPTDGIPTVRPNLGVIFIPTMAGLGYKLPEDQMPWPGEPIAREAILAARDADVTKAELMRLVERFYGIHRERGGESIAPYHADTQGIFDIAHLLYGDEVLYELPYDEQREWVEGLFDLCVDLYIRVTRHLKALLGEDVGCMIHGHGAPQGAYFPTAGVRMSEDTATLLSPGMIDQFILPLIERASEPFAGVFAHYCGLHESFFDQLCGLDCVRAVDLGNPEMYDARALLERCAETGTVLYSRVAGEPGEAWEAYTRRLAGLVQETGARCILGPEVFPETREECQAMLELWHELTDV